VVAAATRDVLPVTKVDGLPIGDGTPGTHWLRMESAFKAAHFR
jgi:hypothetical protein